MNTPFTLVDIKKLLVSVMAQSTIDYYYVEVYMVEGDRDEGERLTVYKRGRNATCVCGIHLSL